MLCDDILRTPACRELGWTAVVGTTEGTDTGRLGR